MSKYSGGQNSLFSYPKIYPAINIPVAATKIFDSVDTNNIGVLYWKQDTLKKIAELSGPLAVSNEFQIHYWALVVRLTFKDTSMIDIAIPTTIFNYAQEVSTAHIDFELKDVNAISEALKPVHNGVTNQLITQLEAVIQSSDIFTVEYISVPLNTMHRHPTGVSSFSGTDLRKDHLKDTGIVFPLKTGDATPSFSSISYNNPVKLVHTEYRIATGNVDSELGISYKKGKCVTYIKDSTTSPSIAEQFLGATPIDKSYVINPSSISNIEKVTNLLDNIQYEPNTQFVKADNLSRTVYTTILPGKLPVVTPPKAKTQNALVFNYEKEIVDSIKALTSLTILDFDELHKLSIPQLTLHLLPMERYYYVNETVDTSSYDDLSHKDLVELAMELQDNIIDELQETPLWDMSSLDTDTVPLSNSMKDKLELLEACGVSTDTLAEADTDTINRWFNELNLP